METITQKLAENGQPGSLCSGDLFGVWVPVTDRTPSPIDGRQERVLVWDGTRHFTARMWDYGRFHCDECMTIDATHWMPLPPSPNANVQPREEQP